MQLDLSSLSDIGALLKTQNAGKGLRSVPIDSIQPDPNQPRKSFSEDALSELAESIRAVGIMQPPIVRSSGSSYMLVSGERRWRAARLLGLDAVEVIVRDDLGGRAQLVENIQREALSHWEIFQVIAAELEVGTTQAELSRELGKSKQWVEAYAAVRKMPAALVLALRENRVADITVMRPLHRLHTDAPELAANLLGSAGPITRGMIADVAADRPLGGFPKAFEPLDTRTATASASGLVPAIADESDENVERAVQTMHTPVPAPHRKTARALPIRIRARFEGASWTVKYTQQRISVDGTTVILLEGEDGSECYGPLEAMRLESIECV